MEDATAEGDPKVDHPDDYDPDGNPIFLGQMKNKHFYRDKRRLLKPEAEPYVKKVLVKKPKPKPVVVDEPERLYYDYEANNSKSVEPPRSRSVQ